MSPFRLHETQTCLSSLGIRFLEEGHLKAQECRSLAQRGDIRAPSCLSMPFTWPSSASSCAAWGALRDLGCGNEDRILPDPTGSWPGCVSGLPSHYSLCCLAEAAVAGGLQRSESKVAVSWTMLSESQVCSGKAQDSREKVIPPLVNTTRNKENINS